MTGGEMFDKVEEILPRATYGWSLCPGHLVAEEEWLCSPIYEHSAEVLRSGMMLQIDIIPSVPGYGLAAESTVVLADETLKEQICQQYPEMWQRMQVRRQYHPAAWHSAFGRCTAHVRHSGLSAALPAGKGHGICEPLSP